MPLIRVGIAGPGGVARVHARALREVNGGELVAVYGHREESVERFAAEFGVIGYTALDRFLNAVDAVIVCTPHNVRSQVILPALEAGKHVLVEKPLATTVGEARLIVKTARDRDVKLGVIFQSRFEEDIRAAKAALAADKLGKLLYLSGYVKWYREPSYYTRWHGAWATEGGGVLMTQAIHMLDLLRWFAGKPLRVFAMTKRARHNIEVEDTAIVMIEFEGGTMAALESSTALYPGYPMRLELHTTAGTLIFEENELVRADISDPDLARALFPGMGRKSGFTRSPDPTSLKMEPHRRQLQDFVQAVREGREPEVTGEDGLETLQLVVAAYASSREGRAINLDDTGRG